MDGKPASFDHRVRILQVLALILPAAVVVYGGIASILVLTALQDQASGTNLFSPLAAGVSVLVVLLSLVVPGQFARFTRQRLSAEHDQLALFSAFQIKTIAGLALLESGAFFCITALLIEHHWWVLGVAAGLVLWMLTWFPSRIRIEHWIENQRYA